MQNGTRLAAVDLGSNSFRLEIGQFDDGQIARAEYYKEIVRQGNGLDADRNLETIERGTNVAIGAIEVRLKSPAVALITLRASPR